MTTFKRKSVQFYRLSPSLLLVITVIFPLKLFAVEQSIQQAQQLSIFNSIDAPRDYLSEKIIGFATNIDRFFGGDRYFQENNQSVVQLDLTRATGYGGDSKFNFSARANLRLPATEGRLHILLESDPEKNITSETAKGQSIINNKVTAPSSLALAARYEKAVENVWHLSSDAGLKFPLPVHPFVRTRGSFSAPIGLWRMKAEESVYWFNSIGVGETTQVDFERALSEPVLFRATSNATWLNDKQNFDLRQDLSIYHNLNDNSALLYQASAIGVSNPQYQLSEYVALLLYRHKLHRDWMFFELSPQLHFPKINNFRSSPAVTMRLEMLFDGSR